MQSLLKYLVIICLVLGLGAGAYFLFKDDLHDLQTNDPAIGSIEHDLQSIKKEVFTSDPLRFNGSPVTNARLTIDGVVAQTNKQRSLESLRELTNSEKLNAAAKLKLDDMFKRQYFEHQSPNGDGPADLATKANYSFVMVGENLALGNFVDDSALVDAWMASPGHRENIMRVGYTEIGVAVGQGVFEGKKTWLAVQEFGTPSSVCPSPDQALSRQIEAGKAELARQESSMNEKKRQLDAYEPKNSAGYEKAVREYNDLIAIYNDLVQKVKAGVQNYNQQAELYNTCLKQFEK